MDVPYGQPRSRGHAGENADGLSMKTWVGPDDRPPAAYSMLRAARSAPTVGHNPSDTGQHVLWYRMRSEGRDAWWYYVPNRIQEHPGTQR